MDLAPCRFIFSSGVLWPKVEDEDSGGVEWTQSLESLLINVGLDGF